MRATLIGLMFVAACGGVLSTDDGGSSQDGGIMPPPKKDGSASKDSAVVDVTIPDVDATPCTETICNGTCVDTSSDPNNCGNCGSVCDSGACHTGTCATGKEPPTGTCAHGLCETGTLLAEGCDPTGCVTTICGPNGVDDEFCCNTSWDNMCVQEVAQNCQPYSCN